jgi:hypothetical protein
VRLAPFGVSLFEQGSDSGEVIARQPGLQHHQSSCLIARSVATSWMRSGSASLGSRRASRIDLNKARNRHVVDAVIELSTKPNCFTVSQLAEGVRPLWSR